MKYSSTDESLNLDEQGLLVAVALGHLPSLLFREKAKAIEDEAGCSLSVCIDHLGLGHCKCCLWNHEKCGSTYHQAVWFHYSLPTGLNTRYTDSGELTLNMDISFRIKVCIVPKCSLDPLQDGTNESFG